MIFVFSLGRLKMSMFSLVNKTYTFQIPTPMYTSTFFQNPQLLRKLYNCHENMGTYNCCNRPLTHPKTVYVVHVWTFWMTLCRFISFLFLLYEFNGPSPIIHHTSKVLKRYGREFDTLNCIMIDDGWGVCGRGGGGVKII